MSKDAYYFPHDSNAKDDPKCVLLIEQLGMEGYGIYWVLVETLRDQPEYRYPVSLLPALARRYNTTAEKVQAVVFNYGLFIVEDDTVFFSQSLIKRMIPLDNRREQARKAGLKSAEKRALINGGSTTVERTQNTCSTIRVNKSRVKESIKENPLTGIKESRRFTPPSPREVGAYIREKGYTRVSADEFIAFYESNGWRVGKNPMKDWKAAVRTWDCRERKKPAAGKSVNDPPVGMMSPKFFDFTK